MFTFSAQRIFPMQTIRSGLIDLLDGIIVLDNYRFKNVYVATVLHRNVLTQTNETVH